MTDADADAGDLAVEAQVNQRVLGVLLVLHGLVHLIGLVLSWKVAEPQGFEYGDVWPDAGTLPAVFVGGVWAAVAMALAIAGLRMAVDHLLDAKVLVVALLASVALCVMSAPAALPGALLSAGMLGAMALIALRRRTARRASG